MKLDTDDQYLFRTWNSQLGWGPLLYNEPPVVSEPWPDTKIFKVKLIIEKEVAGTRTEDLPAVSRASHFS